MASRARNYSAPHVIVIDELSRTDPARVFGEVMTYMEPTLRGVDFYLPSGRQTNIPENLYFVATMNPEDRSVDELDAAMDRRWAKIVLSPDREVLQGFLHKNGVLGAAQGAILDFFVWVQRHYKVGHALFRAVRDAASLDRVIDHQLIPLFEKFFRFSPDTLLEIISSTNLLKERVHASLAPDGSSEAEKDSAPSVPTAAVEAMKT